MTQYKYKYTDADGKPKEKTAEKDSIPTWLKVTPTVGEAGETVVTVSAEATRAQTLLCYSLFVIMRFSVSTFFKVF